MEMWGKGFEYHHSIVTHVVHFSSGGTPWAAPFLPTNAMHLPNYLKPPMKLRAKESRFPTCYNG